MFWNLVISFGTISAAIRLEAFAKSRVNSDAFPPPQILYIVSWRITDGWQCARSRWSKSCAVIGYPRRQDGAIVPARDCSFTVRHHSQWIHIINRLLAKYSVCLWTEPKELSQYPAILTWRLANITHLSEERFQDQIAQTNKNVQSQLKNYTKEQKCSLI